MLNKIKIIGKVIINEEQNERKIDDFTSVSQETVNEVDKSQLRKEPWFYFSLLVPAPSGSLTVLRCITQGETAEELSKKLKKNEIMEVRGYLRNEKDGRQIIIRVVEFTKLGIIISDEDKITDKIDSTQSNQVRLLGKIITDLQAPENKRNSELISFKIAVPREGVKLPLFFCRVHGELITEFNEKLKKGDIIILEGFLQTQKLKKSFDEENEKRLPRISSIICQGFTFLDNDSVNIFSPLDNLTRVFKNVKKIDYSKPKLESRTDEQAIS